MKNMSEKEIRNLIQLHEMAAGRLKLEISPRPTEPECRPEFPPVVGFHRPMHGELSSADEPVVDTPFVAIRYANGCWFINRGGGAPSRPHSWDALLDWIGVDYWETIFTMVAGLPFELPPPSE